MKHHQLRAINQLQAKKDVINNLKPNQALLTADFAMKWIPAASRETQAEWYGKKGISWHIFYVIRKNPEGTDLERRVYQHVFKQQTRQDSAATIALLNNTLERLKQEWPDLGEVFIRSDNAANYHSALTLASVHELSKTGPVKILRWDYSEAQDGKNSSFVLFTS